MSDKPKEDIRNSYSGIPLEPFYGPEDINNFENYSNDINDPGCFPYCRGLYSSGYRKFIWNQRQLTGFGSAKETNERQKLLLEAGQQGYGGKGAFTICFDGPTQFGFDSDHPMAKGAVGGCGLAMDSLRDMEALFDGLPVDKISAGFIIEASAMAILAMHIVNAENNGISRKKLDGGITNNSMLNSFACKNNVFPPKHLPRITGDLIEFCVKEMPQWNSIQYSGYNFAEIGASSTQELAFTIATAIGVTEELVQRELSVDDFAHRYMFFLRLNSNFFEEIAKMRAGRRLWARIMKNRFGAQDKKSTYMRILAQTAGSTLTAQEPLNNIVRASIQALAGVLSGIQSIYITPHDEALHLPTESSQKLAMKTHKILQHEFDLTDVADPLGGSFYIEHLTSEIEKRALEYIEEIDGLGGIVKAIESGFMEREATQFAFELQKQIEEGKRVIVGVNRFVEEEQEYNIETYTHNFEIENRMIERLAELKGERDNSEVKKRLDAVRKAAKDETNLMYPIIEAVRNKATLGEIMGIMKAEFGQAKDIPVLAQNT